MDTDNDPITWSAIQIALPVLTGLLGSAVAFACAALYDRSRRLYVHFTDWKIEFLIVNRLGQAEYEDRPNNSDSARYSFKARFFNKKSSPIGLHRIAIEFTRQEGGRRVIAWRDETPWHDVAGAGLGETRVGLLEVMTLVPHDWSSDRIHGVVKSYDELRGADVWFVAETADGSRLRWRVASISSSAW